MKYIKGHSKSRDNQGSCQLLVKAAFSQSSFFILIDQKASERSIDEKYFELPRLDRIRSILGSGYESFIVTALRRRKSMQNLTFPSFLLASIIGDAHGEVDF